MGAAKARPSPLSIALTPTLTAVELSELRRTWSAEFMPLLSDLPEPEGSGVKSAHFNSKAVPPTHLPSDERGEPQGEGENCAATRRFGPFVNRPSGKGRQFARHTGVSPGHFSLSSHHTAISQSGRRGLIANDELDQSASGDVAASEGRPDLNRCPPRRSVRRGGDQRHVYQNHRGEYRFRSWKYLFRCLGRLRQRRFHRFGRCKWRSVPKRE